MEQSASAGASPTAAAGEATAVRGGIRFRRGSKLPSGRPEIAMVGVVSLDDEPVAEAKPAKSAKAAKAEKPAKTPRKKAVNSEAEAAEVAPPRKKSSGGRAKKAE